MTFLSKLFGNKSKNQKNTPRHSFEWIGGDIHNHLLPGIDDGSENVEQSIFLIKGLQELGIRQSVSTPHVMQGVHENTPQSIQQAHQLLSQELSDRNIDFSIQYSAEYMIDEGLKNWVEKDELCLLPKKHILIEMSYLSESNALFQTILDIQNKGYQPILAHPERYNYYHNNLKIFKEIKNAGCLLQLNLLSISRYYGEPVKSCALTLIKSGMYDFVGTDMHHQKHLIALQNIAEKYDVKELLQPCTIKNIHLFE